MAVEPKVHEPVAFPNVKEPAAWKPLSKDTVDLRLGAHRGDLANQQIIEIARQFGKDLHHLYTFSSHITEKGYDELFARCKHIRSLSLVSAWYVGDRVLKQISGLEHLEELNLQFAGFLVEPGVINTVSEMALQIILKKCTKLRRIDFTCVRITQATFDCIVQCKHIQYVRKLFNELRPQNAEWEALRAARNDLEIERSETGSPIACQETLRHVIGKHYTEQGYVVWNEDQKDDDKVIKRLLTTELFPKEIRPYVSPDELLSGFFDTPARKLIKES